MTRIEPERVAAWFREHPEIKPVRRWFVQRNSNFWRTEIRIVACCGLGATVIEAGAGDRLMSWDVGHNVGVAAEVLDLDADYVCGFVYGWDYEMDGPDFDDDRRGAGYADGHAAYRLTAAATEVRP